MYWFLPFNVSRHTSNLPAYGAIYSLLYVEFWIAPSIFTQLECHHRYIYIPCSYIYLHQTVLTCMLSLQWLSASVQREAACRLLLGWYCIYNNIPHSRHDMARSDLRYGIPNSRHDVVRSDFWNWEARFSQYIYIYELSTGKCWFWTFSGERWLEPLSGNGERGSCHTQVLWCSIYTHTSFIYIYT